MPDERDAALFDRWLDQRDGDAFAELARRHSAVVFDLAARAVGDRSEAEDVLQDALLDLALARTRKPVEVGIAAWLVRFAVCRARNRRSSRKSRERRQRIAGARRPEEVMPDDTYELSDELEHVLERAQPEERLLLAMRYLHGWGYPRIASALSVSEGAARVRVHRALTSVRSRVAEARPGDERRIQNGLAALPVLALDPVRMEGILEGVISAAQAQIVAGATSVGGTTPAAPGSHFVSLGIRILAGLALFAGATLPFALRDSLGRETSLSSRPARTRLARVAAEFAPGTAGSAGSAALERGSPRPRGWDRGALGRLARGERELDAPGHRPPARKAEPAGPTPPDAQVGQAPEPDPNSSEPGLSKTSRPTSRGACAARCEPASFEDERAGVSGSPIRVFAGLASGPGTLADPASPVATNPGATDLSVPADYSKARPAGDGADWVRVADLPPDQRELVQQAAQFVKELRLPEESAGAGLGRLARSRMALRRAKRKVQRKYRRARRELRKAALAHDVLRVETVAAHAAKLSTASAVLGFLVEASAPGAPPVDELRWPDGLDGVDVAGVLDGVLDVLATPLPNGRLPDVLDLAVAGAQDGGTIDAGRLPDALLETH